MDVAARMTLRDVASSETFPVPKYHRVKQALLSRIEDGVWEAGKPIQSEPELCQEFGVSRITVRKAVGDLVHEGKLRTVQGKGTFVATPKLPERFVQRDFGLFEDMARRGLVLRTQVIRQEVIPASDGVAERLGLTTPERVHIIVRVRSVQDEKILVSTTYIPETLCPQLRHDDLTTGSLYQVLTDRYGLTIGHGMRSVEAVAAGHWEARLLDVALASPLLRLDSVAYLPDGRAFEYSEALQRGDRARIEVEFLPAPDEV